MVAAEASSSGSCAVGDILTAEEVIGIGAWRAKLFVSSAKLTKRPASPRTAKRRTPQASASTLWFRMSRSAWPACWRTASRKDLSNSFSTGPGPAGVNERPSPGRGVPHLTLLHLDHAHQNAIRKPDQAMKPPPEPGLAALIIASRL